MGRTNRNRRGVLIQMVSSMAVVSGLFVAALHHSHERNVQDLLSRGERIQAQFLARGAQQHFLLKMKHLPAAFYEAAAYAVGRNPHYDFTVPVKSVADGQVHPSGMDSTSLGPLFFTGGPDTEVQVAGDRLFVVRSRDTRAVSRDPHTMAFMLEHFLVDVTSEFPPEDPDAGSSPIVRFDSVPHSCKAMGKDWQDPFTGFYFVEDARILSQAGGRTYGTDCVAVAAEAQVRVYGQVSPVTGRSLDTPSRLVSTRFQAKDGGWPELAFDQEDEQAYRSRSDRRDWKRDLLAATRSCRRTEMVTSTYTIERSGVLP